MQQLQAAYFLEGISQLFKNEKDELNKIKHHLSFFNISTNENLQTTQPADPIVATINNLLSRGLPTIPSTFIEDIFSTTFHKTQKKTSEHKFSYDFINDEYKSQILRALHIIEPRLTLKKLKNKFNFEDSDDEKDLKNKFLFEVLPTYIGEYFLQIVEPKRTYKSIFYNSDKNKKNFSFGEEKIDFSVEIPYKTAGKYGIPVEIYKTQYVDNTDYLLETEKDRNLSEIDWEQTIRIKKIDFDNIYQKIQPLENFTFNTYFHNLRQNFKNPLYKTNSGLDAIQLALSPLAIARLQKTILQFILAQKLDLNSEKWEIAVIERDVPAAFLAVEDLKKQFAKLFLLEGKNRKLPQISLTIYHTEEFERAELNLLYQGEQLLAEEFDTQKNYDLVLDLSVLERSGFEQPIENNAKHFVSIRSANYIATKRQFETTKLSVFQPIINAKPKKTEEEEDLEFELQDAVIYFMRNIFRRTQISENQLKVLSNIMQLKNSIQVGANFAENTFLYQFAVLLQPAISLIINPNMTVMKEQFENVLSKNIDAVCYINSLQTKPEDRQNAIEKFVNAESLFNFISAEQFETETFRNNLKEINQTGNFFGYAVIDNVDAISEWSHNFTNSYSGLYNNINKFAKTQNASTLPVLGFSQNISPSTISDLNSKINFDKKNIIYDNEKVPKFDFEVLNVKFEDDKNFDGDFEKYASESSIFKENYLAQNLSEVENTIIFTDNPKKNTKKIEYAFKNKKVGYYAGTIENQLNIIGDVESRKSYKNYSDFKNGNIDLLFAVPELAKYSEKTDIKQIVLDSQPLLVENFLEQINLLSKNVNSNIKVLKSDYKEKFKDNEINAEQYLALKLFNKKFGSLEKDLAVAKDILTEISFPTENVSKLITQKAEQEFGEKLVIIPQPTSQPTQLYVYNEFQDILFGYIDFEDKKIVVKASRFKKEIAERILNFIYTQISALQENPIKLLEQWNKNIKKANTKGIATLLPEMQIGEKSRLNINFENDSLEKICEILDNKIDLEHVNQSYLQSYDFESFTKLLDKKLSLRIVFLKDEIKEQLENLYTKTRNFHQTHKTLQRMQNFGVIDCYSVNFVKQEFAVEFSKKEDADYYLPVYEFAQKFVTRAKSLSIFEQLPNFEGSTAAEKSVNCYTAFVHEEIISSHQKSHQKIGDLLYGEEVDISKIVELIENSQNQYLTKLKNAKNDFEIVYELINNAKYHKNELQQIKKSTDKLLQIQPENAECLVLNGYSNLLLDSDKTQIISNLQKIADGFSIYKLDKKPQTNEYLEKIEWVKNNLLENNPDLKNEIDQIFMLKLHNSWLSNFNKRFVASN